MLNQGERMIQMVIGPDPIYVYMAPRVFSNNLKNIQHL